MRTFIAAVLLAILPYSLQATEMCTSGGKVLDEKLGFRDVKFGAAVREIAGLDQVPQDLYKTHRVKAYVRPTDKLEIFDQRLKTITYFFFDDRLFLVDLQWGGNGALQILEGFRDAFGCELQRSDGPAGQDLSLLVVGEKVKFYGSVHFPGIGVYGVAFLQKLGVQQAVDEAIRREASAQF